MRKKIYILAVLLIAGTVFFSCEKEEDMNPAPHQMDGRWKAVSSKDMTTGNYVQFETVSFGITDNGKYFYEDHQSSTDQSGNHQWNRINDGSVNWKEKENTFVMELFVDDYKEWNIEIIRLQEHYFVGNVEWNGNQEQWTFVKDVDYTICGVVLHDAQPVENALVTLQLSEEKKFTDSTSAYGLYYFTDLNTTEPFLLTVKDIGYSDQEAYVQAYEGRVNIVDAISMTEGESTLSKGTITGFAYDKNTLQPLDGIKIGYGDDDDEYTHTGFEGDFTLTVPEGNCNIYANGYSYVTAYEKIDAKSGEYYTINFYLSKAVTISGIIKDNNESRIGEAKVVLYNDEDDIMGSMFSWSGEYEFKDMPAGEYTVYVEKTGYTFAVNEKNVNAQESVTDVDFEGVKLAR